MTTTWWRFAALVGMVVGCGACGSDDAPKRPDPPPHVARTAPGSDTPSTSTTPKPDTPLEDPSAPKTPVEVSILYGSEKKTWLEEQIAAYARTNPTLPNGRPIHVTAKPIGSGEAMTEILEGREKPVVFSPASGAYVTLLNQGWQSRENHTKPVAPAGEPLVLSPIVIAMWKPMAEALGWPAKSLGWSDILKVSRDPKGWAAYGKAEWGDMKLGHTHPEYSNSGLLSTLAIAYAGAKKTRGLTAADLPKVEPLMSQVEEAVVHYGKSTGFFGDAMIERGPTYLSAAVLYENLVIESYAKTPPMPIVAIYPVEGTFWSDHPYSVLDAPWVTPPQREAAAAFLAFLKRVPQQQRAMALGFRPVDPTIKIGAPIDAAHGVDAQQPQTLLEVPDGPTLDALLGAWKRTKKAADIVFVFDKSGSMKGKPLEEAKRGAKAFLATLDERDDVTLIVFNHQVPAPVGPLQVGRDRKQLEARIDGIVAGGDTSLYDATAAAYRLLAARRTASSHRIRAVVVMTDGADTTSRTKLPQLITDLGAKPGDVIERPATVFTIGYGAAANPDVLTQIAKAGAGTFAKGDVDSIIQVYRDLGSYF